MTGTQDIVAGKEGQEFVRHVVFPGILLFMCPPALLMLVTLIMDFQGDMFSFGKHMLSRGLVNTLWTDVWSPLLVAVAIMTAWTLPITIAGSIAQSFATRLAATGAWVVATGVLLMSAGPQLMMRLNIITHSTDYWVYALLIIFSLLEFLLLKYVPGNRFLGPVTPMNNRPPYKDNGTACFVITLVVLAFVALPTSPVHILDASLIYTKFKEIIGACNVLALTLCILLTLKALVSPTNSDVRNDQNPVMAFYWGRELHPMALGESVKQFTNCRFGMMGWACVVLGFALAQYQQNGFVTNAMLVNVTLQIIYIAKFFHWESGYFATMDMQEDRAGFYICWGCLCWITALYTSSTLALVAEKKDIPRPLAAGIFTLGCAAVLFNYAADAERKLVRETGGNCLVWGRKPEIIQAKYVTGDGVEHESLLLVSGFWGISRHSHYLFELSAAFLWSCPGTIQWISHPGMALIVPLAYFIFLTILLFDRSVRDDKRCYNKYGKYWEEYRTAVPYKIIPGMF